MDRLVDSKERSAGEIILFALGFIGFVITASAIVAECPSGAVVGWLLLLFAVLCFMARSLREEA